MCSHTVIYTEDHHNLKEKKKEKKLIFSLKFVKKRKFPVKGQSVGVLYSKLDVKVFQQNCDLLSY